jgi:hypothetical protein
MSMNEILMRFLILGTEKKLLNILLRGIRFVDFTLIKDCVNAAMERSFKGCSTHF